MVKKERIPFLNQLIKSLEEGSSRLEKSYDKKDYELFNKLKKFMLRVQMKIDEVLNEK